MKIGVAPSWIGISMSAPRLARYLTTSRWLFWTAAANAVPPWMTRFRSKFGVSLTMRWTSSRFPSKHAV